MNPISSAASSAAQDRNTHPLPTKSARAPGYLQCHCSLLCGACIGFCCPLQRTCHSRRRLPPGRLSYQLAARSGPGLLSCGCYLALWGKTDCVLNLAPAALAMGGKHAMEKGLVIHIVLRSTLRLVSNRPCQALTVLL